MKIPGQRPSAAQQSTPAPTSQPVQQAAHAQQAQSGDLAGALSQDQIGQVFRPPSQLSPAPTDGQLTAAQLLQVAGVGGEGLSGQGTLTGVVGIQERAMDTQTAPGMERTPVLYTLKQDHAVVAFELEMPVADAEALVGQKVSVEGHIDKTSKYRGVISSPRIGEQAGFTAGQYAQISGKIEHRDNGMGIGGETAPSGPWMVLDSPITVAGKSYAEMHVMDWDLESGAEVTLNGRLDPRTWGGVETEGGAYLALSGVSNLTAGEPAFDGKVFKSSAGKELDEIYSYDNPMIADEPATLFVVDQGSDKIWLGASGGFRPQGSNPFVGVRGSMELRSATEADRAMLKENSDGSMTYQGKKLTLVGMEEPPPGTADMFSHEWFFEPASNTLLHLVSGGFAGFQRRLDQIASGKPEVGPGLPI